MGKIGFKGSRSCGVAHGVRVKLSRSPAKRQTPAKRHTPAKRRRLEQSFRQITLAYPTMARQPLQQGSRVVLKKKKYKHIVGTIKRSTADGKFLVQWDHRNDEDQVNSGVYSHTRLQRAAAPPPAAAAAAPAAAAAAPAAAAAAAAASAASAERVDLSDDEDDDPQVVDEGDSLSAEEEEPADPSANEDINDEDSGLVGNGIGGARYDDELVSLSSDGSSVDMVDGFDINDLDPDKILDSDLRLEIINHEEDEARRTARYFEKLIEYEEKKEELLTNGFSVTKKDGKGSNAREYVWKMIEDWEPEEAFEDYPNLGVAGFNFEDIAERRYPLLDLFEHLFPFPIKSGLLNMNAKAKAAIASGLLHSNFKLVSMQEIYVFFAILFGAHARGGGGEALFEQGSEETHGMEGAPDFGTKYGMKLYRFEQIKRIFPFFFTHPSKTAQDDPWYMISYAVDKFNENRRVTVCSSKKKTPDEMMSASNPQTTKTGKGNPHLNMPELPNISYIFRKPKPLGTEFKAVACAARRVTIYLEIQRGKEAMREMKYSSDLGGTAACTLRMFESCYDAGRNPEDVKPSIVYADSWFASVKTARSIADVGDLDHDFVGPVKTAHSLFPRNEIQELMKDWPGGTYCVFQCAELGDLLAIGYKYNTKTVLTFVATKNAGSTKPGRSYTARFADEFGNQKSRDVLRPQVISDYFEASNAIDIINQVRQDHLALEQLWLTRNCWFRIDTTLIGIVATDCFHALKSGLPDNHKWKAKNFMSMRRFASLLSADFYRKSQVSSSAINSGDNNPLPRSAPTVATDIPSVVDVSATDTVSPVSALTQAQERDRGTVCSVAPASERAPYVPEQFRATHKIVRVKGERGTCAVKNCSGKVASKCAQCSFDAQKPVFYCNGECYGDKPPRWCFYAHLCEKFSGDFNDPKFNADVKAWNERRHLNGKPI